jgi:hypothetical protein
MPLQSMTDEHETIKFKNPLNVNVGQARVIYAESTTVKGGAFVAEGWVLPGGRRTLDLKMATAFAANMNMLMRRPT